MSNRKTIWVLNQFAGKPDSGWGERHYFFSKYWVQKGYQVFIFSASYSHMFKNQPVTDGKRFTIETLEENITYCWVRIPQYKGDGTVTKLWAGIVFSFNLILLNKNFLPNPDYIIVSSPPVFTGFSGWYLKKKFKAEKFIFEVRDLWPLTPMLLKGYSKWHPVILGLAWFEKFAYHKADYIVSLLPNAYQYIDKISKKSEKFRWIPNGIDKSLLHSESLSHEIEQLIPKNSFIVCYTGTMGMANALEYLMDATHLIENEKIKILMIGDGYLKPELIERSNKTNTVFIPKVTKNQLQNIINQVDVCFIGRNNTPLFDYGVSSNKYFDYMLNAKPILASTRKVSDPVEQSGCGIIVEPDNAQAIAEGIIQIFNKSVEERNEMGKKGYNFVLKYHNFDYLSDLYIETFNLK